MATGARSAPTRSRSKVSSTVGRLGIPGLVEDAASVESSEYAISLDDSSSIHSSDYSRSSLDEDSTTVGGSTVAESELSLIGEGKSESTPRRALIEQTAAYHIGQPSTGSSSGSPWVDETDSSSCTSSQSPLSSHYNNGIERRRFEEARSRLLAQQQRAPRPSRSVRPPPPLPPRAESPSSVCTGKDPSKPIDVTGSPNVSFAPSILEQVRQARLEAKRIKSQKQDLFLPTARIVGIAPQRREISKVEPVEWNKACVAVKHTVPHVVPIFHSPDDDVSSMGGTFPDFRAMLYLHRHHKSHRGDVEHGAPKHVAAQKRTLDASDPVSLGGCLAQRTDLELFLICLVVAALVTLVILLALMIASK
jgi:hypothetical protein